MTTATVTSLGELTIKQSGTAPRWRAITNVRLAQIWVIPGTQLTYQLPTFKAGDTIDVQAITLDTPVLSAVVPAPTVLAPISLPHNLPTSCGGAR